MHHHSWIVSSLYDYLLRFGMLLLLGSHFPLTVSRMLVLIGSDYSLVSLGTARLLLLGLYYLLQLLVLLLLWLSFSRLIVLLLVLYSIDLIFLLGVLVLVVLVTAVDVLVSVPFVSGVVRHVPPVVFHLPVVVVSVVVFECFPLFFLSPNVLLLLLPFVVPVNN